MVTQSDGVWLNELLVLPFCKRIKSAYLFGPYHHRDDHPFLVLAVHRLHRLVACLSYLGHHGVANPDYFGDFYPHPCFFYQETWNDLYIHGVRAIGTCTLCDHGRCCPYPVLRLRAYRAYQIRPTFDDCLAVYFVSSRSCRRYGIYVCSSTLLGCVDYSKRDVVGESMHLENSRNARLLQNNFNVEIDITWRWLVKPIDWSKLYH